MGNGGRDQFNYESHQTTTSVFQDFYRRVAESPTLAPADKADVTAELQEVEQELAKGDQADATFIQRRLRAIQQMAPDILEVVLTTFANPLAGLGMVAKKIADKMNAQGVAAGSG
jgi:truncated hemoglobin YjbI